MANEFFDSGNKVLLKDRKELSLSGITDVDSFDESVITASTNLGELIIKGTALKIQTINTETGEMNVTGEDVSSLAFTGEKNNGGGFFAKIFR